MQLNYLQDYKTEKQNNINNVYIELVFYYYTQRYHCLSMITLPLLALSIPPKIFKIVVFPAPLGPNTTVSSPSSISKETLSKL